MKFLDKCFYQPSGRFDVYAKHSFESLIDMGYEYCLGYFIAISLDSGGWTIQSLAEELSTSTDVLYGMYQAYEPIIDYTEPGDSYTSSTADFTTIFRDIEDYIRVGAL